MPNFTGTNGDDNIIGTQDSDTINALLGIDTVDGLGGSDTLIVDYSAVLWDPYAGASVPGPIPFIITSTGGSFSGTVRTGGSSTAFSNIEHLQIKLDFWHSHVFLDGAALALGATVTLDGGLGGETLEADLSALASVNLTHGAGGTAASFGTFLNFEAFRLNLTEAADNVTTGEADDVLNGNGGDDVLNSGGGHDRLSGGSGTNILNAGEGNDQITSTGIDTVDGGVGDFNYDRWTGDYGSSTANLVFTRDTAAGTATLSNGTTLSGIESVGLTTGSGDDVFTFATPGGYNEEFLIEAGAGEDRLTFKGTAFSGTHSVVSADGAGAFAGFVGSGRFSGIEHLNFVFADMYDSIALNAAPLLSGATLSLDAAGGNDRLDLDLTAFGSISFVVAADGSLTTNVPATLLNFEIYHIASGAGNDTITTGNGDDAVHSGGGDDTITTGNGNDVVHSGGGDDVVDTAGGNDLLDGGSGADAMAGGGDNDIYIVDNAGDTVTENAGGGTDEIRTDLASFSLAALVNIEKLTGTSPSGQSLTGNGSNNVITAGFGNDVIDGGAGDDQLDGNGGDDLYIVDSAGDVVIEYWGYGTDIIYSAVSYSLNDYSQVENLSTLSWEGTEALNLTGNQRDNTLIGNAGANQLNGGFGIDMMIGREGDDSYFVDHAGDQAIEYAGLGVDTIYSDVHYSLNDGSEIENISAASLSANWTLNLTGNGLANTLTGNAGRNQLNGAGGNDAMYGRQGNDIYIVDSAGDQAIELAGQGIDTIYSAVSYALNDASEVEALATLSFEGTGAINLTGNGLANTLIGNDGNNQLDGRGGADVMVGRAGGDIYLVDHATDAIFESVGGGYDVIYSAMSFALTNDQEIEGISTITWELTTAVDLTGNSADNYLIGNAGTNVLDGKGGSDVLQGREGTDTFAFTIVPGAGHSDLILDFSAADDTIRLEGAAFGGMPAGPLNPDAFVTGTAAQDTDDRIVYNQATGQLFFDADGSGGGAAVLFATLQGAPVITASDFAVI